MMIQLDGLRPKLVSIAKTSYPDVSMAVLDALVCPEAIAMGDAYCALQLLF